MLVAEILNVLNEAHKPELSFFLGDVEFYYIEELDRLAFRTRNILVTYDVDALLYECEEKRLFENTWRMPEEIVADYFVKEVVKKKVNRRENW